MIPNGHTATYSFFTSIIRLGLYHPPIGFIRNITLFLYYWDKDVKRDKSKKGKKSRSEILFFKIATGTKPDKHPRRSRRHPNGCI
jgi:hypothetical protein